ncbi:co-chaperone YbbN [Trichocoleus sp. FACHB-262]|uniref:thioredoxin family protein n=1 Tax=Trichocoleus sp. FACHB-262 TaxID=2692869 RepID=UPI001686F0A0|nr:thioredoxin domain-containing protein [Trichocoleus sp. FACHB-262]MBD2123934.1 thioredoxin fold domain-containing protein [Trichocoleus sp. FACHB-262]
MTGSVITISDAEFAATALEPTSKLVVIYFWAPWCGPCRLTAPLMDWAATHYGDRLKVVKMEIDPNPETVAKYQVQGVPALIFLKDGEVAASIEGAIGKQKLIDLLETHLPK